MERIDDQTKNAISLYEHIRSYAALVDCPLNEKGEAILRNELNATMAQPSSPNAKKFIQAAIDLLDDNGVEQ